MSKLGRNDPCACGSGKKYKKCCLEVERRDELKIHPLFSRLYSKRDRASAIQKLIDFSEGDAFQDDIESAHEIYWGDRLSDLNEDEVERLGSSPQTGINFNAWFLYDFEVEKGQSMTDLFLVAKGKKLNRGEKAYLDIARLTTVRLYEVRRVTKDDGFLLEDLWDGKSYDVREQAASHSFEQWDLMAARLIEVGADRWEIEAEIYNYAPQGKEVLLKMLKKIHKSDVKRNAKFQDAQVYFKRVGVHFNHWWLDLTVFPERSEMPKMQTIEGDECVSTRVIFHIRDRRKFETALEASTAFEQDEAGEHIWIEPVAEGVRVLGGLQFKKDWLILETQSKERGERGLKVLRALAGTALKYRVTEYEDFKQSLQSEAPKRKKRPEALPPEVSGDIMREMLSKHYEKWLDDKIPALGNRTPRHAVTLKTIRPKVIRLLKEMENNQAHGLTVGQMDFDFTWLWDALGLMEER